MPVKFLHKAPPSGKKRGPVAHPQAEDIPTIVAVQQEAHRIITNEATMQVDTDTGEIQHYSPPNFDQDKDPKKVLKEYERIRAHFTDLLTKYPEAEKVWGKCVESMERRIAEYKEFRGRIDAKKGKP